VDMCTNYLRPERYVYVAVSMFACVCVFVRVQNIPRSY